MFFTLSKTLSLIAVPSDFLVVMAIFGIVLWRTRWRRFGLRLAVVAMTVMVVIGILPVGNLLVMSLESRFPRWAPSGTPDGIIVLGGAVDPDVSVERGEPVIGSGLQRLTVVPKLARDYPNARIVYSGGNYSGGNGNLSGGASEADIAGPLLVEMGLPKGRLELERLSRNTAENAVFTKTLVNPKPGERWLLVTSAAHMPRAVGCFRRAGFPVEAYPVDWHSGNDIWNTVLQPPIFSAGLAKFDRAMREWIGLVTCWMTGRTSALFPGP
jgi:uncharacterized SAM-binding protein YcdF (DUF218 family)